MNRTRLGETVLYRGLLSIIIGANNSQRATVGRAGMSNPQRAATDTRASKLPGLLFIVAGKDQARFLIALPWCFVAEPMREP